MRQTQVYRTHCVQHTSSASARAVVCLNRRRSTAPTISSSKSNVVVLAGAFTLPESYAPDIEFIDQFGTSCPVCTWRGWNPLRTCTYPTCIHIRKTQAVLERMTSYVMNRNVFDCFRDRRLQLVQGVHVRQTRGSGNSSEPHEHTVSGTRIADFLQPGDRRVRTGYNSRPHA